MKFNIIAALLFVFTTYVEVQAMLSETQKAMIKSKFVSEGVSCLKDHPLSLSDIRTIRNKMLPDGEDAKCFAQCLFQKLGIMDDMGKLSAEGAKKNATQLFNDSEDHLSKVDQIIQACSSVNDIELTEEGVKQCDRAKLTFTCLVENAPKFGFDINF